MTIDQADIGTLTDKLASPTPSPLTEGERTLLVAALGHLAADQAVIERQRRLLAVHDESGERLDAILAASLGAVAQAARGAAPADGFDFEAAAAARRDLAEAIEDARSARQVIAASLAFARDIAALL